jgi:hypothetical protein
MMFTCNVSIPRKRPIQHLEISHVRDIKPTPSWKTTITLPAHLPRKQTANPFLNAIVMRLDYSLFVLVSESNQTLVVDRVVQQPVQLTINCHITHRFSTSSPSAVSATHPRARTQTSVRPRLARSTLSWSSASSCRRDRGSPAYSAPHAIRRACAPPAR